VGDVVFDAEASYLLAGEVGSIVRDDSVGNPVAAYYVLLEELDNLLPADLRDQYCLNPLGKVVGGDQQETQLRLCSWEKSDYVQSPLHEGPRVAQGVEVRARPA